MKELYLLSHNERRPFFELAAYESQKTFEIIEKDYWVVWTLERLFSLPELANHLTFKGGTSLSKVFGVIERFSEDIDVSIEKEFLGFDKTKNPEELASRKKQQAMLVDLFRVCTKYIQEELLNNLKKVIKSKLKTDQGWKVVIDPHDSQTLLFYYPSVSKASYIRPIIKIEMGARSEHWPVSEHPIQSYAKTMLKDKINESVVLVRVLDAERTFWEKATILHQYAHLPDNKVLPLRLSRHWYDFFKLLNSPIKVSALKNVDLLEKVANHKKVYFASSWANYDSARRGTLKLLPLKRVMDNLADDYHQMQPMFFGKTPAWDEVIEIIGEFELGFNSG